MSERPITFSTDEVRAILVGRKTQTRRLVKPQPQADPSSSMPWVDDGPTPSGVGRRGHSLCIDDSPWSVGDRLWVRETWAKDSAMPNGVRYYATDAVSGLRKKRPSIHMPRWASRIALTVKRVWVQRVQDISEADAVCEGVLPKEQWPSDLATVHRIPALLEDYGRAAKEVFQNVWDSIHGPGAWSRNDWIWAVEFEVVK